MIPYAPFLPYFDAPTHHMGLFTFCTLLFLKTTFFVVFFHWGIRSKKFRKVKNFQVWIAWYFFFIKGLKSQGLKINSCKSLSYYIWFIHKFKFSQILRLTKAGSNLYPRNVFYSCRSQTPDVYPNDGPYLRIPLIWM